MASQSVLELAVNTGKWDSGLKKAKSALDNFTTASGGLQQALGKDSDKMQKFVQMMGSMESKAKTAKGQMNDYKGTIEQLTMQYNRMTVAQQKTIGQDYLKTIDQLRQKYQAVNQEVQQMNRNLQQTPSTPKEGGFLSDMGGKMSGALAVFGGNMMTKAAGAIANLGSEMYGMVQQGIELAKQGEGIRNAFERLGRGDILDGLREATHGTVTDLELMKAAVKFNDFKLPLEELGTMLAFAQQKAKDTGQSVDYMVDSIVTGLGRKSLMILDNLGLSAAEIKDKMAETGDMTKAVGAIIREQMAKAGDYVETAADRALQANVSIQNKLEELGRKFTPVEEASNQLWTSMKIGILDVIGGPLATLLNQLTEAGRMRNALNGINAMGGEGQTLAGKHLNTLRQYSASHNTADVASLVKRQVARYAELEAQEWKKYNQQNAKLSQLRSKYGSGWGVGGGLEKDMEASRNRALAWRQVSAEYQAGAKQILSPAKPVPAISTNNPTVGKGGKTIAGEQDDFKEVEEIVGLLNLQKQKLDDLQAMKPFAETEEEIARLNKDIEKANTEYQRLSNLGKEVKYQTQTDPSIQNEAGMSAYINSIKKQLETADYGTSLYNGLSAQLTDMTTLQNLVGESLKAGLGTVMFDVADETGMDFWTRAMEGGVEDIDWKTIVDKINEARKKAGLDAISLDFKTGSVGSGSSDKGKKNNRYLSKNEEGKTELKLSDAVGGIASGIGSMTSSLEQLGIDVPKGMKDVLGGFQAVTGLLTGITTIITAIEAISTADTILPFAGGGVVKAAGGYRVPGRTFSGDLVPARLNAGELVLNQAQAGVIANALQDRDFGGGVSLQPYVDGEKIFLGMNNTSKRMGRGEIVTTGTLRRLGLI